MTELPHSASPVDAIAPGTHLREWEVLGFRGRGSYGVVFEARRSSWLDEAPRALKVFDPIVSSAARGSLLAEFAALTEVEHPHLLGGIDAFDLASEPYAGCVVFVLELADEDLAGRIARLGPLEVQAVAGIGSEVAAGLGALHEMGRVHGDVKPENILRVGDRWVLGDFGVTGLLEGSYAVTPGATIDYRPPELANSPPGSRLHRSTDVWALGVTMHVAATSRHPFPGPDPMLRYAAVVRGDRAPSPGLDPQLAEIVERSCLQPDPRDRAEATVLSDQLRRLTAATSRAEPSAVDGERHPPPPGLRQVTTASPAGLAGPTERLARPPEPPQVSTASPAAPTERPLSAPLPATSGRPGTVWATLVVVAVVATAVICQLVALAAGALPFQLETRRVAYVLVSAGVLGVGLEPAASACRARSGSRLGRSLGVAWPQARPLVIAAIGLTWLVATALLFGVVA